MINRYLLKIGFLFLGLWSIAQHSSFRSRSFKMPFHKVVSAEFTAYQAKAASGNDLRLDDILTPGNKDSFVYNIEDSVQLAIKVSAVGDSSYQNEPIYLEIKDFKDSIVLRDTQHVSLLSDSSKLVFFKKLSLKRLGKYTAVANIYPTVDDVSTNNSGTHSFIILPDVDMSVTTIFQPTKNDSFEVNSTGFSPVIRVISLGRLPLIEVPVVAQLLYQGKVLQERREIIDLTYLNSKIIVFDSFMPTEFGLLQLRCFPDIPYDIFRLNDTIQTDVKVKNSNDVKVLATIIPGSQTRYELGQKFNTTIGISNLGRIDQDSVVVVITIKDEDAMLQYSDSLQTILGQFSNKSVVFKQFECNKLSEYTICSYVRLRTDQYRNNDTLCTAFYVTEQYNLKLNSVLWPQDKRYYEASSQFVYPEVELRNIGRDSAVDAPVSIHIKNKAGVLVYADTLVSTLDVGGVKKVKFNKRFSTNVLGTYSAELVNIWALESSRSKTDTIRTAFEIRPRVELGLTQLITPVKGDTIELGSDVNTKLSVHNRGTEDVAYLKVYVALIDELGDTLYDDTLAYEHLGVDASINLQSSEFWQVKKEGGHTILAQILTADSLTADNTLTMEFRVAKYYDGAVVAINAPNSGLQWVTGKKYAPEATFKNLGIRDYKLPSVTCEIWGDSLLYKSIKDIDSAAGASVSRSFDSVSFATIKNNLRVVFYISMFNDKYPQNDSLEYFFNVIKGVNSTSDLLANHVLIYPNPFSNEVYISSDIVINYIHIYTSTGALISPDTYENFGDKLLLNVPDGVYYLYIDTDMGKVVKVLVKTE
jgi:hypothetical protein